MPVMLGIFKMSWKCRAAIREIKRQSHVLLFLSFSPWNDHSKLSDHEKMCVESSLLLGAPTWEAHQVPRCRWLSPFFNTVSKQISSAKNP